MKRSTLTLATAMTGMACAASASAAPLANTGVTDWTYFRNDNGGQVLNANTSSPSFGPADGTSANTLNAAAAEGGWGSSASLAEGETIRVTGTMSWVTGGFMGGGQTIYATGLRFGLFNSDGSLASGSPGYKASTEDEPDNTFEGLFTGRMNGFVFSTGGDADQLNETVNSETGTWADATDYDFTFEVERTGADSVQVRFLMSGGDVNIDAFANHAGGATFDFNRVAFSLGELPIDTLSLSDVTVSVVPEPASLALLAVGGLCVAGRRRRA